MYNIKNLQQAVDAYPQFLAEWFTVQQLNPLIITIDENLTSPDYSAMKPFPITSWEYAGITPNNGYHVFTTDQPYDNYFNTYVGYGKWFMDILIDDIDGIQYPITHVPPVHDVLTNPNIYKKCGWFYGKVGGLYYKTYLLPGTSDEELLNVLNSHQFAISFWFYMTDPNYEYGSSTDLYLLAIYSYQGFGLRLHPNVVWTKTKHVEFPHPSFGTWHFYTINFIEDTVQVYIDGELVVTDTGHDIGTKSYITTLGVLPYIYAPCDMCMSAMTFWSAPLSEDEITSIYQNDQYVLKDKIVWDLPLYNPASDYSGWVSNDYMGTSYPEYYDNYSDDISYLPTIGTRYGIADNYAKYFDYSLPMTQLLWTMSKDKILLYVPTSGREEYKNIFWLSTNFSALQQAIFFDKLHSFTLYYKPVLFTEANRW